MPCPSKRNIFIPKIDNNSNATKTIMIVVLVTPPVSGGGGDETLGVISILILFGLLDIYILENILILCNLS
jgi:hypothetical protein